MELFSHLHWNLPQFLRLRPNFFRTYTGILGLSLRLTSLFGAAKLFFALALESAPFFALTLEYFAFRLLAPTLSFLPTCSNHLNMLWSCDQLPLYLVDNSQNLNLAYFHFISQLRCNPQDTGQSSRLKSAARAGRPAGYKSAPQLMAGNQVVGRGSFEMTEPRPQMIDVTLGPIGLKFGELPQIHQVVAL